MKKILISAVAIFVLASVSHSKMVIGIQAPFSGVSVSHSDFTQSERWMGVYGTIEYNFFTLYREVVGPEGKILTLAVSDTPIFGVELSYGRNTSLGGKDEMKARESVTEYKNNSNIVRALLKYYFPVSKESRFHLYAGCGPEVFMTIREEKVGEEYEKIGELTNIRVAAPIGLDYDINAAKTMKLTTLLSFQYGVSSTVNKSATTIVYGLGLGLKRCF